MPMANHSPVSKYSGGKYAAAGYRTDKALPVAPNTRFENIGLLSDQLIPGSTLSIEHEANVITIR